MIEPGIVDFHRKFTRGVVLAFNVTWLDCNIDSDVLVAPYNDSYI